MPPELMARRQLIPAGGAAKLLPADGASQGHFGISRVLDGDTSAIGAYLDDANGHESGQSQGGT
jgi:hypothetical protein